MGGVSIIEHLKTTIRNWAFNVRLVSTQHSRDYTMFVSSDIDRLIENVANTYQTYSNYNRNVAGVNTIETQESTDMRTSEQRLHDSINQAVMQYLAEVAAEMRL